jgi:phage shock protein A
MIKLIRKWWNYLTAKMTGKFEESADPKVQLEQAIREAQQQHRRLTEQAANVIAQQKQTQLRLERAIDELGKSNASAKQALMLADEAAKKGDAAKSGEYADAAEAFAGKLISLEKQVAELKEMLFNTTQASDQAKAAVQQNATALQRKYTEREKLLSQLDQAKMREEMNKAMTQLTATVGDEVPTFEEVRRKIEGRLAKAEGMAELTGASVESRMLEVEQAGDRAEAQARLSELRTQLGLKAPEPAQLPAAAEEPQKSEGS